jgi:hypothetical protein
MKNTILLTILFSFIVGLESCAVVGGIFKAGMGVGIFIVLAILVFVVWAISKAGKK